ncbi:MAG: nucleoside recognition domain-containing protein [Oscillospiraceae bacterium]|nr:nucleoside recognition domain-containing protein [Oscillospiraceae bacterium]
MSRFLWRPRFQNTVFSLGVCLMLLSLLLFPDQSVTAAKDGVQLCLNVIVPSLFPFFVLSTLCVELGLIRALGSLTGPLMAPLFRVGGACAGAFLLGIVGGYPVGARTAIALYESGQCSRDEAERLMSFCNNSGPAFILGVVGAGIFSSSAAGLWLYGAHVAASILVGLLFRFYGKGTVTVSEFSPAHSADISVSELFIRAVKDAFSSAMNICAFVIFFTVVIRLLFLTGIITRLASILVLLLGNLGLHQDMAESLLSGAIEMTSGVWSLRDMAASLGNRLCMAAFILGWAGLSVHCQVLSFIGKSGLSTRTYFFGKLLHGILSAVLVFLLSRRLGWNHSVSAILAGQVTTIAHLSFGRALTISLGAALGLWILLSLLSIPAAIKSAFLRRKNHV